MRNVLVIVGNAGLQDDIRRTLSGKGLRVTTVSNGHEGMQLLNEDDFDLVIADMLAETRDGIEVAKKVAIDFPAQPVIAVSGSSLANSDAYQSLVVQLGVNGFLRYPFGKDTLFQTVGQVLEHVRRKGTRVHRNALAESAA